MNDIKLFEVCKADRSTVIDIDQVRSLLAEGANPNYSHHCDLFPNINRTTDYTFPLLSVIAGKENSTEVAQILLEAGADISQTDTCIGNTILLTAIARGDKKLATFIINYIVLSDNPIIQTILSQKDTGGECQNTPLVLALKKNMDDIAIMLINAGVDVNVLCRNDESALHWACILRKDPIIISLLEHGSLTAISNRYGHTPYEYYGYELKLIDLNNPINEFGIVKCLTANMREFTDLYFHVSDYQRDLSLQNRIKMRNMNPINQVLLECMYAQGTADLTLDQQHHVIVEEQQPRIKKAYNRLPKSSIYSGTNELIEVFSNILSECRQEIINVRFKEAHLSLSVKNLDRGKIEELLQDQTKINNQCSDGFAALHWASMRRDNGLIERLVQLGADPMMKNKYGRTALDYYSYQINVDDVKDNISPELYESIRKRKSLGLGKSEMPEFSEVYSNDPSVDLGASGRNKKPIDLTIFEPKYEHLSKPN